MCSTGNIVGAIVGIAAAYFTGGLSVAAEAGVAGAAGSAAGSAAGGIAATNVGGYTLGSIATAASLGSTVGGLVQSASAAGKSETPQFVPGAPNPVADTSAVQDQARAAATMRRRAVGAGSPRSLLATAGGGLGDTSQAQIGSANAAPVMKSTLGA